jgi:hypothetical protein
MEYFAITIALFADDAALYTQSWRPDTITRRLTVAVNRLQSYITKWRMKLNPRKTEAILLTKRRPREGGKIRLGDVDIPWEQSVKYLGLRMTRTLNFSIQTKHSANKALGMLIKLFPLLGKDLTLTVSTKLHIYKTIIRPMLTYAAPIWCSMSTSAYRQLEVVQNKCLRVVANAPRGTPITNLLASLGMETIQSYCRQLAASLYEACLEHSNPLIRPIGNYTLQDLSQVYRKYKHKRPKHCLL